MKTGQLEIMPPMQRRDDYAIVNCGHLIFLIGGNLATTDDIFNVIKQKWTTAPLLVSEYSHNLSLIAIKKRFVYGLGGCGRFGATPGTGMEKVCKLDTLRRAKGWEEFLIQSPSSENSTGYGLINLPDLHGPCNILVFGGHETGTRSLVFRPNLLPSDFTFTELEK